MTANGRKGSVPEGLGEILARALKEAGVRGPSRDSSLDDAWREVVGEDVARHSRVSSLRKGILTVEVFSAPLREELEVYRREELLRALRGRLGGVGPDRLSFRLV
jgi:predicted nucleic acid-binding Zn ribbon protein